MTRLFACLCLLCAVALPAWAADGVVVRDDFRTGTGPAPAGWTLSGGAGRWETMARPGGGRAISIAGTGSDTNYWRRDVPGLKPNTTYRIAYWARATEGTGGGCVISGLDVCNRDQGVGAEWRRYSFCFTTPASVAGAFLRLGQWMQRGTIYFTDVTLTEVQCISRTQGASRLAAGERVDGRDYEFTAPLNEDGSNSSPLLASHTASFNSNRWVLTGGSEVVYRHHAPAGRFASAKVTVNLNYYTSGVCAVSASRDGAQWTEIGRIGAQSSKTFALPDGLRPADTLYVKLAGAAASDAAGNSAPGAFQVDTYTLQAKLDASAGPARGGADAYVAIEGCDPRLEVRIEDAGAMGLGAGNVVRLSVESAATAPIRCRAIATVTPAKGRAITASRSVTIAPGKPTALALPYSVAATGESTLVLALEPEKGGKPLFRATTSLYVPSYFATDYGYAIGGGPGGQLWWCEGTYKIHPDRDVPGASTRKAAIEMSAARNEREHAQLVLRAGANPAPLTVRAGKLTGPGGATIPASAIQLREVAYVRVRVATDRTGVAADWPDPLPPLPTPWQPVPGRNNPIFITVKVPENARAGDYAGSITLAGGGSTTTVPLHLHVWNYTLPKHAALRSGFGINPANIRRYHNLKSDEAMAKVWDLYMQAFAERGICTYNPMALAPYEIRLEGVNWAGGTRDTAVLHAGASSMRVDDDSTSAPITCSSAALIPVTPGKRYELSWWVKTGQPGQVYEVSCGCFRPDRQWMAYHNIDLQVTGSGEWQRVSVDISDRIAKEAGFINVGLRPVVWTERGEKTGAAWFDDVTLTEDGGPRNLVVDGGFELDNKPTVAIDFTAFDKAAHRYLDEVGFNSFTVNIPGLGGGRHPNYDNGSFLGYADGTPEFDALMTQFGKILQDHLAEKGWLSKAYVYWYDEPETNDYPFVTKGMAKLHKYVPKIKRMLTEEFQKELYGSIDLWCPITPNYAPAPAAARQKLGEEVWWYVCTGPKEPYCTLFIDHPAVEMRMWVWQTWKYAVQGLLIWETTYWTSRALPGPTVQNPWEDPQSYVDAEPGTNAGVWGNGDGRFYYPPNRHPNEDTTTEYVTGPIIALRWEMLAKGIQDWEMFRVLAQRVKAEKAKVVGRRRDPVLLRAESLLTVPPSVCRDMVDFSRDPKPLLEHRRKVAEAIEELGRRSAK